MTRAESAVGPGSGAVGEQVGDERAGLDPQPALARPVEDGALQDGGDQGAGDAGPGRVPAGVQDAGGGVCRLEAERRASAGSGVEVHAEPLQPRDVPDGLGAQDPHGVGVVEPGARGEGVGDVRRHGIAGRGLPRGEHRRDAALGVEGVALLEGSLAQEHHLARRSAVPDRVGREQRGIQPRDAAADNHQPRRPGHGRAASIRSRATFAGAATSSATVIRLTTSPRTSASSTQAR